MVNRDAIEFDLIQLLNGERVLRLTEPKSGLALEKKLGPKETVIPQKEKLVRAFEAALASIDSASAGK